MEPPARKQFSFFVADPGREVECERRLRDQLSRTGQQSVDANVRDLLAPDDGRFTYFTKYLPPEAHDRLLVSGCAIGSEMIRARNGFGFGEIHGSEVNQFLVDLARYRLVGQEGFETIFYDGSTLPYEDGAFSAVMSAHIIEHTPHPKRYLREQLRVMKPGGFLFLEFPGRYHPVELHTGLPSLEWLPWPVRDWILRFKASPHSRESPQARLYYDEVRRELRPISVWQIRLWLLSSEGRLVHHYEPAPGFVRLIVRKGPAPKGRASVAG